ncbi:alanine--tRNA ligase-related protein [Bacillus sp. S/N-304-OC-R1]|uniref:alanyl-tRNA editing protein n=1 Tax=Bacillus sp. S/N-304-OC-R1 TaxID=2758034 RepID=UPI001C8D00F3|nr:alanine--tRNA ligase-related protein [Bacillus sp. S/N-304-OC-R1]MBY0121221.1 alanyl-tRNA editing protein [Bacillus sp. S/N-304-OC-R1]
MENKLYYKDPYMHTFRAHVLKQEIDEQGKQYVVLNETAFYPTGGGQPHDTGYIDDVKVIDVEEVNGEIRHYLEKEWQGSQNEVQGQIDWARRFDFMQQHAGQHILTAAFVELFNIPTIGFHLGRETVTIDLDIDQLSESQVIEAEQLANKIVLEGRPIETKWVAEEELVNYQLRKELAVTENIRLVIIPDFDYNGCGGTHPKTTAEVGAIKILDWERQKNKIRVQFVCGGRVISQLHQKQKVIKELTDLLNAPELDLAAAAKKLIDSGKEREKSLEALQEVLLSYEAKELLNHAESTEKGKVICEVFQNRSIQELQKLGRSIAAESNEAVVFLANELNGKLQFVCARGSEVTSSMKKVSGALLGLINGKGGGSDQFAQGGGESLLSGEQLLQHAKELVIQEKN